MGLCLFNVSFIAISITFPPFRASYRIKWEQKLVKLEDLYYAFIGHKRLELEGPLEIE